jgi:ATP-dependent Clp protease ATP-binding subunit ClpC
LQVLEDGVLTDSQGRHVDFRNTVLILTSNVGAGEMSVGKSLGFTANTTLESDLDAQKSRMMNALKATFRPEFLNRIDDVIVFNSLSNEDIEKIASLMLRDVARRISDLGITVEFTPAVSSLLAKEGFDPTYGARPLRRAIVRLVEDSFSAEMLEGKIVTGDRILADVSNGLITYSKQ